MENKKIIILASERSGTNLLRTLIDKHKDICGPVASHFFDSLKQNMKKYGELSEKENVTLLLKHMILLANHPYHDWKLEIGSEQIYSIYNVNSFETAFNAMYTAKAVQEGKLHYISKDNHMFYHIETLDNLENVKYIYLYRDPRDLVASWMRTPLNMHAIYDVIIKWVSEQNKILEISKNHKIYFLSYESLIENTEKSITELLNFVELQIDSNCFTTNKNNLESSRNELWKNLSKPIIKNNSKNYLKTLSKRDIKIIESKAKTIMDELGYNLDTKANWKPYKGFGYELKLKRKLSKYRNRNFFNKKMGELQDKWELIKSFNKELDK